MLGTPYTIVGEEVAVTTAVDLLEIVSPADGITVVEMFEVSQSSDPATDEQLNILVHLGSTSGSGGTVLTPAPVNLGDVAYGGTVESFNTTQSTEGTKLWSASFNILNGYILPAELEFPVSPSDTLIIELQTTPADSLTMTISAKIRFIGG